MAAPRNYWMVSVGHSYFATSKERGFDLLGLGKAHKKRVQRMEVGDRVLYYVLDWRVFATVATITSTYFEDHTKVWEWPEPGEDLPYRVRLRPVIVLKEGEFIDARLVAPRMQYVRKWTPEHWPLAFLGLLHLIPKEDFMMLEDEMHKRTRMPQVHTEPDPDSRCALDTLPMR